MKYLTEKHDYEKNLKTLKIDQNDYRWKKMFL